MAEEIKITVTLNDRASPAIQSLTKSVKAFDKSVDELNGKLQALDKMQSSIRKDLNEGSRSLNALNQELGEAYRGIGQTKKAVDRGMMDRVGNTPQPAQERASRQQSRNIEKEEADLSRLSNRADGVGMAGEFFGKLWKLGIGKMLIGSAGKLWEAFLDSAYGGQMTSSVLSGAISGGTIGSVLGVPGIAFGAIAGGASGWISGKAKSFLAEDEAFKTYYRELYEAGEARSAESLEAGTATAAQRELDAIAFNRLLGEGAGDRYLSDLRRMAAATPLEYGELTGMSRSLAVGFGDSPERMLELMQAIGDAGSAVGVTAQDMSMMAQAMSRMQSSDKATLEYLNILQERGVNVIGMLADEYGKTQGEIYDMISKGKIKGRSAVDIIERGMQEAYAGAMETMAQTYNGLTSTLSDTMAEIDNARGEGYTGERKEGLAAEIEAYGGAPDGRLMLADPYLYAGKYGKPHRRAVEVVGNWLYAMPDVLDRDARNRSPRYTLFGL